MWRYCLRLARSGLVGLSLILCSALVALWVESHRHSYMIICDRLQESEREWRPSAWGAAVKGSCLHVWQMVERGEPRRVIFPGPLGEVREIPTPRPAEGWRFSSSGAEAWDSSIAPADVRWRFGRIAWVASVWPWRMRMVVVPLSLLALVAGAAPVVWAAGRIRRWQAQRRAAAGLCPACGYDLRASSGRCPECGRDRDDRRVCDLGGGCRRWAWAITVVACLVAAMAGLMVGGLVVWGPAASGGTTPYGVPVP